MAINSDLPFSKGGLEPSLGSLEGGMGEEASVQNITVQTAVAALADLNACSNALKSSPESSISGEEQEKQLKSEELRDACCAFIRDGFLLKASVNAKRIPLEPMKSQVLSKVCDACLAGGKLGMAESAANHMQDEQIKNEAFRDISIAYLAEQKLAEARRLAKQMTIEPMQSDLLGDIFYAYFSRGLLSEAFGLVKLLKDIPEELKPGLREFDLRKRIAHLCSIGNTAEYEHYENFIEKEANWPKEIAHGLKNAPDALKCKIAPHLDTLIQAFENTSTLFINPNIEKTAISIQNGELVILPSGYLGHAISMIFYNGYMVICDCGKAEGSQTFQVYKIDPKLVTTDVIEEIKIANNHSAKLLAISLEAIFETVSAEKLEAHPIYQVAPSVQTVGNCTFACMEGATLAALGLLSLDEENGMENTKSAVESLFVHLKLSKQEEYLESHLSPNEAIHFDSYLTVNALLNTFPSLMRSPEVDLSRFPRAQEELTHIAFLHGH